MGNYITIQAEIDLNECLEHLDEADLLMEYIDRSGSSNFDFDKISLLEKQNLENLLNKMGRINHFELETFLNKY